MTSFILIICFSSILFCETMIIDSTKLNGTWMPNSSYLWIISNPEERYDYSIKKFSWGNAKRLVNTSIEIDTEAKSYFDPGMAIFKIKEYQEIDDSTYKVIIYYPSVDDTSEPLFENYVILHFLNEDLFWIESDFFEDQGPIYGKNALWYRLSGENVMSKAAYINDNRVRIRVQPNLDCDTWGFLNKDEKVTVIDKSKNKQKIGTMENYWYKVDVSYYPDGWVYGEYITFD